MESATEPVEASIEISEAQEESSEIEESALEAPEGTKDSAGSEAPAQENDGKYDVEGILELSDDGFGFLRFDNFLTSNKDIYVSPTQIRRFGLRTGDKIFGIARKPRGTEKFGALLYVKTVNGFDPMTAKRRPHFDSLTPIFANEKIVLENSSIDLSTRVMSSGVVRMAQLAWRHRHRRGRRMGGGGALLTRGTPSATNDFQQQTKHYNRRNT